MRALHGDELLGDRPADALVFERTRPGDDEEFGRIENHATGIGIHGNRPRGSCEFGRGRRPHLRVSMDCRSDRSTVNLNAPPCAVTDAAEIPRLPQAKDLTVGPTANRTEPTMASLQICQRASHAIASPPCPVFHQESSA